MRPHEYLSLLEAAYLRKVHPDTIRRAVRRGDLPHRRVLGKIRVSLNDLDAFLNRHCPNRAFVTFEEAATAEED